MCRALEAEKGGSHPEAASVTHIRTRSATQTAAGLWQEGEAGVAPSAGLRCLAVPGHSLKRQFSPPSSKQSSQARACLCLRPSVPASSLPSPSATWASRLCCMIFVILYNDTTHVTHFLRACLSGPGSAFLHPFWNLFIKPHLSWIWLEWH